LKVGKNGRGHRGTREGGTAIYQYGLLGDKKEEPALFQKEDGKKNPAKKKWG